MSEIIELIGKTLVEIKHLSDRSDLVIFKCSDGEEFRMYHAQNCCEGVSIDNVDGDVNDLIGTPILSASEESNRDANPSGIDKGYQESFTWTFYKIATIKGSITIRWYGESNGYYSESVEFIKKEINK